MTCALTPEEVAEELRIGRTQVFALLRSGELPSFRIGRLRRVRRSDLDQYVDRQVRAHEAQRGEGAVNTAPFHARLN